MEWMIRGWVGGWVGCYIFVHLCHVMSHCAHTYIHTYTHTHTHTHTQPKSNHSHAHLHPLQTLRASVSSFFPNWRNLPSDITPYVAGRRKIIWPLWSVTTQCFFTGALASVHAFECAASISFRHVPRLVMELKPLSTRCVALILLSWRSSLFLKSSGCFRKFVEPNCVRSL